MEREKRGGYPKAMTLILPNFPHLASLISPLTSLLLLNSIYIVTLGVVVALLIFVFILYGFF
jgi:hypothetical protein